MGTNRASGIQAEKVSVDTVSGGVRLDGSMVELKLDTTSGSCEISPDDRIQEMDLESVSGSMRINAQ